ncbi:MAG: glycosyltransferase family 2 protein [Fuerstia sp.]|nr:glycosyltransferase family 2 protein [Fuerstiella sp.]
MAVIEISVVVPVYGSEPTLPLLWSRLSGVLKNCSATYEVIFVDDGSRDGSWQQLKVLQSENPDCVIAIQLMRNFGQHNALMAGFHHVRGQVVITIDDDLQHPPEEIPRLLEILRDEDLDVVYGTYDTKKHASWRNAGSILAVWFFRSIFRVSVTPTAFRAMRREVVECILPYDKNFTIIDGLLAWSTQRIGEIKVQHHPRAEGQSGYSIRKLLLQSMNVLTNFSLAPLQLVSAVGILTSLAGLSLAAYYLVLYFSSRVGVPGYASLMVTLLVASGLQLLSLGIIGEYIGRVLLNINQKPQFVQRTVLSASTPALSELRTNVRSSG